MGWWQCCPRLDGQTQRVYVPCLEDGVRIFRYVNNELVAVGTLRCMEEAVFLAVHSTDVLVVTGEFFQFRDICLVNVSTDTVIRALVRPIEAWFNSPHHVSVLGNTVLACDGDNTLVTTPCDNSSTGQVVPTPDGLNKVHCIHTDYHSSFLVMDWASHAVFVLDMAGKLRRRIPTYIGDLQDCAVVQSQPWLGSLRHIAVMTTE